MQDVVNQIMANPLFSLVLALLAFLLCFLFSRVFFFRIALFLVALFALYTGYVYFFQEKYPILRLIHKQLINGPKKVGEYIPADLNIKVY